MTPRLLFFFILFFIPFVSEAADLRFSMDSLMTSVADTITLSVVVDSDEVFNAFESNIHFDSDMLTLSAARTGDSVVPFWIVRPTLTASGTITLSGIVPGGIEGQNLTILQLAFLPKKSGSSVIGFTGTRILRHDGYGTPLDVRLTPVFLEIVEGSGEDTNEMNDTIPPETFVPYLESRDDGTSVLYLHTIDKGSGVATYYVRESKHGFLLPFAPWVASDGAYTLRLDPTETHVQIKVVDGAGNSRIIEYPTAQTMHRSVVLWSTILLVLLALLFVYQRRMRSSGPRVDA